MRRIALSGAAVAAGLAAAIVGIAGCGSAGGQSPGGPAVRVPAGQLRRSVGDAYVFLSQMMDRYASGSTPAWCRASPGARSDGSTLRPRRLLRHAGGGRVHGRRDGGRPEDRAGTTAWYILAAGKADPFVLISASRAPAQGAR